MACQSAFGASSLPEHPEQPAELRAAPDLMPGAVEELMRYLSVADSPAGRMCPGRAMLCAFSRSAVRRNSIRAGSSSGSAA
ncbi:hypothetical protein [Actinopolymorpha cephalotaxi]|uniref:Uncharacterized protein n=1 Tax=Actinopolymorpha cephalotaxi TaxID=504797 RepID=A0ABX2S3Q9_9ACTN|nr:hypothetical protein [Actinopolymorpha cephalotaxi]NYH84234.1 hypothetical protein [Actinopolymorpha cephalotaxi]